MIAVELSREASSTSSAAARPIDACRSIGVPRAPTTFDGQRHCRFRQVRPCAARYSDALAKAQPLKMERYVMQASVVHRRDFLVATSHGGGRRDTCHLRDDHARSRTQLRENRRLRGISRVVLSTRLSPTGGLYDFGSGRPCPSRLALRCSARQSLPTSPYTLAATLASLKRQAGYSLVDCARLPGMAKWLSQYLIAKECTP